MAPILEIYLLFIMLARKQQSTLYAPFSVDEPITFIILKLYIMWQTENKNHLYIKCKLSKNIWKHFQKSTKT